ncbi:MAG: beta-glucosidase [Leptospirales bacterium]|nr:beta-glucosidase [Leptospirales bacterium]HNK99798.1 GH1 family beta-glucosidase [Leptospiraceae bacterium]
MNRTEFGPDFVFGTATAAYQIEGAWQEDGKGESIWDRFSHTRGKIENNQTGDVACDHYHRFESDLVILKSLGIQHYRFSISWSRIFPEGRGRVEQRGVDFYKRLIAACAARGITPWVTLFHWDLPQALEDKGGWPARDTLDAFLEYVDFCTRTFSEIKNWMILNEPMVFTGGGYLIGVHAPGKRSPSKFFAAAHHAALAQAEGGRITRANCPGAQVGSTYSMTHAEAWSFAPRHQAARDRFDAVINRLFLDPACGRGYPWDTVPSLKKIQKHMKSGDDAKLKCDFDFIGIQNYTRDVVRRSILMPYVWARPVSAKKRRVPETEMGWEVYPQGIYELLRKFGSYPEIKKIYVTENGAAFPDQVQDGRVHDEKRIAFLRAYIGEVIRAKRDGSPVHGYFVWSFLDNFEWAFGYRPRFGLVHVDYETQVRIPKDSALFYRDLIAGKDV